MDSSSNDSVVSRDGHCPPRFTSRRIMKPLLKATKKLAKLRCQEQLLAKYGEFDIFSSIRPKVGKKFIQESHNDMLKSILEDARLKIIQLGLKEKNEMIVNAQIELCRIHTDMQKLPFSEYMELKRKANKVETSVFADLQTNMERKVNVFKDSRNIASDFSESLPSPTLNLIKVRKKHRRTQRQVRHAYDKRRRARKKEEKKLLIADEIKNIKDSNLVKNFSTEDVPDSAYLFLALGSTFCAKQTPKLHDYIFDSKEFCRKLAWGAFFEDKKRRHNASDLKELFEEEDEAEV